MNSLGPEEYYKEVFRLLRMSNNTSPEMRKAINKRIRQLNASRHAEILAPMPYKSKMYPAASAMAELFNSDVDTLLGIKKESAAEIINIEDLWNGKYGK